MSLRFKPDDFFGYIQSYGDNFRVCGEKISANCNRIFDEWLASAPVVYAKWKVPGTEVLVPEWHQLEGKPGNTHQARLVCIEEIKKECKHEYVCKHCQEKE